MRAAITSRIWISSRVTIVERDERIDFERYVYSTLPYSNLVRCDDHEASLRRRAGVKIKKSPLRATDERGPV